jgi:hypothetical protein
VGEEARLALEEDDPVMRRKGGRERESGDAAADHDHIRKNHDVMIITSDCLLQL